MVEDVSPFFVFLFGLFWFLFGLVFFEVQSTIFEISGSFGFEMGQTDVSQFIATGRDWTHFYFLDGCLLFGERVFRVETVLYLLLFTDNLLYFVISVNLLLVSALLDDSYLYLDGGFHTVVTHSKVYYLRLFH